MEFVVKVMLHDSLVHVALFSHIHLQATDGSVDAADRDFVCSHM